MKKAISLIMVLAIMLTTIPTGYTAAADIKADVKKEQQEALYENTFYYVINENKEAVVTGFAETCPENVVIPETIEGYPVTTIAESLKNQSNIKSIKMTSITTIQDFAFSNFRKLESIDIGSKVISIGMDAFCYTAFSDDESNWENNMLYLSYCLIDVDKEKISSSITVKDGIKLVCDKAFIFADKLTEIKMPSVEIIGGNAFSYNNSLKSVEIPSAKSIGQCAFSQCNGLETIEMPKVEAIKSNAFDFCEKLIKVDMPAVKMVEEYAFSHCNSISEVSLPSATYLGNYAFGSCDSLSKVNIPNVETIGDYAFYSCNLLSSIELHKVMSLGKEAFVFCDILSKAIFYCNAPTNVGENPFLYCADNFKIYYAKGTSGWSSPEWNGYPTREFTPGQPITDITLGDANGDDKINTGDATHVLKYIVGKVTLSSDLMNAADYNRDSKVNTGDAVAILKYIASH